MNIYVGNLNYKLKEDELKEVFEEYGEVSSVKIITDKYSGKSKGFGFVVMDNDDEAKNAIQEVNGKEIAEKAVIVNEARPRPENNSFNRNKFRR